MNNKKTHCVEKKNILLFLAQKNPANHISRKMIGIRIEMGTVGHVVQVGKIIQQNILNKGKTTIQKKATMTNPCRKKGKFK